MNRDQSKSEVKSIGTESYDVSGKSIGNHEQWTGREHALSMRRRNGVCMHRGEPRIEPILPDHNETCNPDTD